MIPNTPRAMKNWEGLRQVRPQTPRPELGSPQPTTANLLDTRHRSHAQPWEFPTTRRVPSSVPGACTVALHSSVPTLLSETMYLLALCLENVVNSHKDVSTPDISICCSKHVCNLSAVIPCPFSSGPQWQMTVESFENQEPGLVTKPVPAIAHSALTHIRMVPPWFSLPHHCCWY